MKHRIKYLAFPVVALGLAMGALSACEVPEDDGTTHADEVVKSEKAKGNIKDDAKSKKDKAKPAPNYTAAQENAIAKATEYLDYSAFSKKGLIEQLKFEGFKPKDAEFGVNHIKVNWNTQADAKAKEYLDQGSFSRQGLIDQLKFEGFTQQQATYGVNHNGL